MFIVNPTFSLIAWGAVVGIYFWIMQRNLAQPRRRRAQRHLRRVRRVGGGEGDRSFA